VTTANAGAHVYYIIDVTRWLIDNKQSGFVDPQ
jgi:hypothetical protein